MMRVYKFYLALVAILLALCMGNSIMDSSLTSLPTSLAITRSTQAPRLLKSTMNSTTDIPPTTMTRPSLLLSTVSSSSSSSTAGTTTTYFIILRTSNTTHLDNLGASILNVNGTTNQTTAIFNCQSIKLGNCLITVPVSATNGPSTAELTLTSVDSVTPLTDRLKFTTSLMIQYAIHTYVVRCDITAFFNASCTTTDYAWESSDAFTFPYTSTYLRTVSALTYMSIPITAGLEKLSRSVGVSTAVADPTAPATEGTRLHPEEHFKSPLAWIAAPIVLLVVAGALIAGALFWRKRKRSADQPASSESGEDTAWGVFGKAELPTVGCGIVEAPGHEQEWVELDAVGNEISELPTNWNVPELSATWEVAELPG
ncbi:PAF acetylhydrolase family protein [Aspergillus tubingensis]|uniref:PAF acetylhydrolase family protein n=1 Tax=Aspergillus tubingensis TaxID=5068 RepID=UPI00157A0D4B|nr:PAF acetylhydrolase family protein [Aspergillus tubingensis]GFN21603.1 PAF acetylhydrolase family protein [Aspergillus tubingensis]GLB20914.1 hypothetical protein AtubIFM61612_010862 [Aspergillus tubingensis]